MTGPLYAIGRFCSRHHWPVIGALAGRSRSPWSSIGQAAGSKTSENLTLPGTGSTIATELLEDNLPEQAYGSNPLVFEAPAGEKLTEPKYAPAIEETRQAAWKRCGDVNSAISPLSPEGSKPSLLSEDQQIAYIPVVLGVGPGEIDEEEAQADPRRRRAGRAGRPRDRRSAATSASSSPNPTTEVSEAIGLAAAVIILLFAFGTATAMMLPIVSAVIGLACALSIIRAARARAARCRASPRPWRR